MLSYLGQGIDMVEVKRIKKIYQKYNQKFLKRIFSSNEINELKGNFLEDQKLIEKIASRFAVKEAASKALGTGFRMGIKFSDFEIFNDKFGKPFLQINGVAKNIIDEKKNNESLESCVSISKEKDFVVAVVTFIII